MPLIDITAPGLEPVTSAEVKAAARIDGTEFDSQIAVIIPAARRLAEMELGRVLITQTKELVLDSFPTGGIDLRIPSVQSIASVKYIDVNGTEQTLATNQYTLDTSSTPCWLLPAYGTDWPATQDSANAVRVRFVAGFGDAAANVPETIRMWIIAHAAQMLRSPDGLGDEKPMQYLGGLLDAHRVWKLA